MPVEPIAIVKGTRNLKAAQVFVDFVNSPEHLVLMAKERFRIPARADFMPEELPEWIPDEFRYDIENSVVQEDPNAAHRKVTMPIDWQAFDSNIDEWMNRWDSEIKGKFRQ